MNVFVSGSLRVLFVVCSCFKACWINAGLPLHLRFPAPDDTPAEWDKYTHEYGYSRVILVDVQRVFACLEIQAGKTDRAFLSSVGKLQGKFSSRITNAMSAQPSWRTGLETKPLGVSGSGSLNIYMFFSKT